MPGDYVVGIDVGTTSTRVTVYETDGTLFSEGRAPHRVAHPHPGWAEEDAEDWWSAVRAASLAALERFPQLRQNIAGIAITSMRQTFVCVDRSLHPLRPGILWYDTRHATQADWVRSHIGCQAVYRLTGSPPGRRAIYKLMWLKANEPEVYAATAHLLFVPDFILHRLTGELVTTPGVSCTSGCLDVSAKTQWATDFIVGCGLDPAPRNSGRAGDRRGCCRNRLPAGHPRGASCRRPGLWQFRHWRLPAWLARHQRRYLLRSSDPFGTSPGG